MFSISFIFIFPFSLVRVGGSGVGPHRGDGERHEGALHDVGYGPGQKINFYHQTLNIELNGLYSESQQTWEFSDDVKLIYLARASWHATSP